ncbi:Cytochrome P450 monooxygenase COX2 [Fusarium oxysporum f. sp. albedinis]|nr:Cytochrome P450 monooxygenase COX2 [Fusarium oxysporum f. sp. albedinis]
MDRGTREPASPTLNRTSRWGWWPSSRWPAPWSPHCHRPSPAPPHPRTAPPLELALITFDHRHCLVHAVLLVDPHDVHEDRVSVALDDVVAALVVVDLLSDVAGLAKKKVQVAYDMALFVMPKLWTPALRWHLSTEVGDPKRKNLLCCEYQWTRECSGGQYCHRTYRIGYLQKKNHAVLPEDSMFYGASKATRGSCE